MSGVSAVGVCPSCGSFRAKIDACDFCGWINTFYDILFEERLRKIAAMNDRFKFKIKPSDKQLKTYLPNRKALVA